MKLKNIFFSLLLLTASNVLSQSHDYNWLLGSRNDNNLLNFNPDSLTIQKQSRGMAMAGSNTSMSDANGNLLFYSNGCYIANSNHDTMKHGGIISPGELQRFYCDSGGSPWRQGVIALPAPNNDSIYYVFNIDMNTPFFGHPTYLSLAPYHLYYQKINMNKNNGIGEVVERNGIAVKDTLAHSSLQAVRHSNGADWWIIMPKLHSNCYWIVLLNKDGVQSPELKCIGKVWSDWDAGQAVFTPDLKKYIRYSFYNGIHIYDFDNENGIFFNSIHIDTHTIDSTSLGGAAISGNSRFLYITRPFRVFQYDLQADDIGNSEVKVAEWDGFRNPSPTIFYLAALAPDSKIYISSSSSTKNLHVINYPDCKGDLCGFAQHGIELPAFNFASIPNFPQYRNNKSIDCSTVSTISRINSDLEVEIYPNPAHSEITVALSKESSNLLSIELFSSLGTLFFSENFDEKIDFYNIHVGSLPRGAYFLKIKTEDSSFVVKKVILH